MISVITTYRNPGSFLDEAIGSLCRQTHADWRLYLCDDGSTDDSPARAAAAADRDGRIVLLSSGGAGRRAALAMCHARVDTEHVAWLDADDRLLPTALARCLEVLEARPGFGLVYTAHRKIDAQGRVVAAPAGRAFIIDRLLTKFLPFHFRLMRTDAVRAAGGVRDDYEVGIDYDLALRLSEAAPVVHLAEPLYEYRVHPAQISSARHLEQRYASARAVREAVARRGLAEHIRLAVDDQTGRFSLHPRGRRRPAPLRAAAALRERIRPRACPPAGAVRTAQIWPDLDDDLLVAGLRDGLHRVGVARWPGPMNLGAMVRGAPPGPPPDVVWLHRVDRLILGPDADALATERPGEREAHIELLRLALARARGAGSRVLWLRDGAREADPSCEDAVGRWCDQQITVGGAAAPPEGLGHFAELLPVFGRAEARAQLGWEPDPGAPPALGPAGAPLPNQAAGPWVLLLDPDGTAPPRALAAVDGPVALCQRTERRPWLADGRPGWHPVPWPRDLFGLARLIAAADVVVVPSDAPAPLATACRSLGRIALPVDRDDPSAGALLAELAPPDRRRREQDVLAAALRRDWRSVVARWLESCGTGRACGP